MVVIMQCSCLNGLDVVGGESSIVGFSIQVP